MHYRVPSHVLRATIETEEVLLNTGTGQYHAVSGSGTELLADFGVGRTLDEACRRIAEATGEELAIVVADARRFVAELAARGLVEEVPE